MSSDNNTDWSEVVITAGIVIGVLLWLTGNLDLDDTKQRQPLNTPTTTIEWEYTP